MQSTPKLLIILFSLLLNFNTAAQNEINNVIYEADESGNIVSGNLSELLNHVRQGKAIRVGWTLEFNHPTTNEPAKIEHWSDAGFLTIINGHLFAQINPIAQQSPKLSNPPEVKLIDGKPNGWVAIISTTGILEQHFAENPMTKRIIDAMEKRGASKDEISKRLESMAKQNVKTKWAVQS